MDSPYSYFVTCERGAEGALRRELVELGLHAPTGARGGVSFAGRFADGMRVCLWARTAMRVLLQVGDFPCPDATALYEGIAALDWSAHLDARHTFAVRAHAGGAPGLAHDGFVALKSKDAIVDRLRKDTGERPSVDTHDPDVNVAVHLHEGRARVFLDLAGEPLHRRGYRVAMTEAPLKETLAAAVLALADVSVEHTMIDPMAGSGTFAIEQALRARAMAPGLRRRFGFERWPSQAHASTLSALRAEAAATQKASAPATIVCRDIDAEAIAAARRNAAAAGVDADIVFEVGPLSALSPPSATGTLCTNPPYGERLHKPRRGGRDMARELARAASLFWGWRIALLAPAQGFAAALGQRPDFTHRLWNGGIEVRLERYTLGRAP